MSAAERKRASATSPTARVIRSHAGPMYVLHESVLVDSVMSLLPSLARLQLGIDGPAGKRRARDADFFKYRDWTNSYLRYLIQEEATVWVASEINGGPKYIFASRSPAVYYAMEAAANPRMTVSDADGGRHNDFEYVEDFMSDDPITEADGYFEMIGQTRPRSYGIRKGRREGRDDVAKKAATDELLITLEASRLGLAPAMYGAHIFHNADEPDKLPTTYLMENGVSLLSALQDFDGAIDPIKIALESSAVWITRGTTLLRQLESAAEHGLLMTDIKPENVIFVGAAQVDAKFIDLEGQFCTFLDEPVEWSANCVFLINATLLLNYLLRRLLLSSSYTSKEKESVRLCLNWLAAPIAERLKILREQGGWQGLCGVVGAITQLPAPGVVVHEADQQAIAEMVLERAEKYGQWVRDLAPAANPPDQPLLDTTDEVGEIDFDALAMEASKETSEISPFWEIVSKILSSKLVDPDYYLPSTRTFNDKLIARLVKQKVMLLDRLDKALEERNAEIMLKDFAED